MKCSTQYFKCLIFIFIVSGFQRASAWSLVHTISDLQVLDDAEISSWTIVHESSLKYSTCNRVKCLGGYGVFGTGAYAQKTYSGLPSHTQVHVYFEFLEIDSWDHEKFYVTVDSNQIYVYDFFFSPSLPNFCGATSWEDEIFMFAYKVPHSGSSMTIKFHSTLDQNALDESWGIRNLQLYFYNCGGTNSCYSCAAFPKEDLPYSCYSSLFDLCPSAGADDKNGMSCSFCHSSCETCFSGLITGCLSCTTTYLYVQSPSVTQTCESVCPDGFYPNNGPPRLCSDCHGSCKTCTGPNNNDCVSCPSSVTPYLYNSNQCLSACPDGLYNDASNICQNCNTRCSKCAAAGYNNCQACNSGFYLKTTNCYVASECTSAFGWPNSSGNICSSCDPSCLTCSGANNNNCITCPSSGTMYLYNSNQCMSVCPDGTYPDASKICQTCNSRCTKCLSSGYLNCQACSNGYYIKGTTCYDSAGCITNFGWPNSSGNLCSNCHSSCLTCSGPNNNNCLTCPSTGTMYLYSSNQCLTVCPDGTYPDASKICQTCDSRCTKCLSAGYLNCQACSNGYYLKATTCDDPNECIAAFGWPNSSGNLCSNCHSTCLTCSGPNDYNCLSCSAANNLFHQYPTQGVDGKCLNPCISPNKYSHEPTRRCQTKCPAPTWGVDTTSSCEDTCPTTNYYKKDDGTVRVCASCHPDCATCSGSTNTECLSCTGTLYLYGTACLSSCGSGKYGASTDNTCKACDPQCKECTTPDQPTKCIACGSNKFLKSNQCLSSCGSNQFKEYSDQTCQNCHSECLTCFGPNNNQCLSCNSPKFYDEDTNLCVPSCTTPKFAYDDGIERKCLKTCIGIYYALNTTRACGTNCLTTKEYKDEGDNICKACFTNCATCYGCGEDNCLTCTGLRFLTSDNKCETICGNGYYAKTSDNKCYPCSSNCKTCVSPDQPSQCLSCFSGKFLQGNLCMTTCNAPDFGVSDTSLCSANCYTANQFPDPTDRLCKPCHETCKTCSDLTSTGCINCDPPYFLVDGQCRTECNSVSLFPNPTNRQCDRCESTCQSCSGPLVSNCLSCSYPLYLYQNQCLVQCPTSPTIPLYKNPASSSCTSDCLSNYFIDKAAGECKICDKVCSTCFKEGPFGCLVCSAGLLFTKNLSFCSEKCLDGYYQKAGTNECSACDMSCSSCSKSADSCSRCSKNYYLSEILNSKCLDCQGSNQFIESSTQICRTCQLDSCKKCASKEACQTCEDGYFILVVGDMRVCQKKTVVVPKLSIVFEPRIFEIEFSTIWENMFNNISAITNLTVSGLEAADLTYFFEKKASKTFSLFVKYTKAIPENSSFTITFNPSNEGVENNAYSLEPKSINMTFSQYEPCSEKKQWGREQKACIDALAITPKLTSFRDNAENFVLEFDKPLPDSISDKFEDQIILGLKNYSGRAVLSKSFDEEKKMKVYIECKYSESFKYGPILSVEILESSVMKSIEEVYFTQTKFETSVSSFLILSSDDKRKIQLAGEANRQGAEAAKFALLMQNILSAGSTLAMKNLLIMEYIRLLRFSEIDYPPNVVEIFNANFQFIQVIPDVNIYEDPIDRRPDGAFEKYNVSPYIFNNIGGNLMNLGLFYFISLTILFIEACMADKFLIVGTSFFVIKRIFIWNFVLSCLFSNYVGMTLYTGTGLHWYSTESTRGKIDFVLSILMFLVILIIPIAVYLKIKSLRVIKIREHQEVVRKDREMTLMKSKIESLREFDREHTKKRTNIQSSTIIIDSGTNMFTPRSPGEKSAEANSVVGNASIPEQKLEAPKPVENTNKIARQSFVAMVWDSLRGKDPRKLDAFAGRKRPSLFNKLKNAFVSNRFAAVEAEPEIKNTFRFNKVDAEESNVFNKSMDLQHRIENNTSALTTPTLISTDVGPKSEVNLDIPVLKKRPSLFRRSLMAFNETIMKMKQPLKVDEIREKYAIFLDDFKEGSYLWEFYFFFDLMRQIILVLLILSLRKWPLIQVSLFLCFNFLLFAVLVIKRPFKKLIEQAHSVFNECCLLVSSSTAIYLAYLDNTNETDIAVRIKVGWMIVGTNLSLISVLLLRTLFEIFKTFRRILKLAVDFYKKTKEKHILEFKQRKPKK